MSILRYHKNQKQTKAKTVSIENNRRKEETIHSKCHIPTKNLKLFKINYHVGYIFATVPVFFCLSFLDVYYMVQNGWYSKVLNIDVVRRYAFKRNM